MAHPCENCLLKMMCVNACQDFINYSRQSSVHDTVKGIDRKLIFKRLISSITKIPIKMPITATQVKKK